MSNVVKIIKIMEIKFVVKISDSAFYDKLIMKLASCMAMSFM